MKKLRSILALLMVAAMMLSFSAVAMAVDIEEEEPPVEEVIEIAAEEPALDGASQLIYYPPASEYESVDEYLTTIKGDGFFFFYQQYGMEGNWVRVDAAAQTAAAQDISLIDCTLGDILCRQLVADPGAGDAAPNPDTYTYFVIPAEVIAADEGKAPEHHGHDWRVDVDAEYNYNCEDGGTVGYICTKCGETKTEVLEPGSHVWSKDPIRIIKEPTCTAEGEGEFTCLICGAKKTDTLPKVEHLYAAVITELPHCVKDSANNAAPTSPVPFEMTDFVFEVKCIYCGAVPSTGSGGGPGGPGGGSKKLTGKILPEEFGGEEADERPAYYDEKTYFIPVSAEDEEIQVVVKGEAFYYGGIVDFPLGDKPESPKIDLPLVYEGEIELPFNVPVDIIGRERDPISSAGYLVYDYMSSRNGEWWMSQVHRLGVVDQLITKEATCTEVGAARFRCSYCNWDAEDVEIPAKNHGFTVRYYGEMGFAPFFGTVELEDLPIDPDELEFDEEFGYFFPDRPSYYVFPAEDFGDLRLVKTERANCYDLEQTWMCADCGETVVAYWQNCYIFVFKDGSVSYILDKDEVTYDMTEVAQIIEGHLLVEGPVESEQHTFIDDFSVPFSWTDDNNKTHNVVVTMADIVSNDVLDIVGVKNLEDLAEEIEESEDEDVMTIVDLKFGGVTEGPDRKLVANCSEGGYILLKCKFYDDDARHTTEETLSNKMLVLKEGDTIEDKLNPKGGPKPYHDGDVIIIFNEATGSYSLGKVVENEETGKFELTNAKCYKLIPIAAPGHRWGKWYTETVPTGDAVNYTYVRQCQFCYKVEREIAESKPCTSANKEHTPGEWDVIIEAECESDGWKILRCAECNEIIDEEEIPALGHSFTTYAVTKAPTCTEAGIEIAVCDNGCGGSDERVIEATGHDWAENVTKPATCTEDGSVTRTCNTCGTTETLEVLPAEGHKYGEPSAITEPTCTEGGLQQKVCATCGDISYEVIPALGHDAVDVEEVPAGSGKGGTTAGVVCGRCGVLLEGCEEITYTVVPTGLKVVDGALTGEGAVEVKGGEGLTDLYARITYTFVRAADDAETETISVSGIVPVIDGKFIPYSYSGAGTLTGVYINLLNTPESGPAYGEYSVAPVVAL